MGVAIKETQAIVFLAFEACDMIRVDQIAAMTLYKARIFELALHGGNRPRTE
jgi:hypothetical protein